MVTARDRDTARWPTLAFVGCVGAIVGAVVAGGLVAVGVIVGVGLGVAVAVAVAATVAVATGVGVAGSGVGVNASVTACVCSAPICATSLARTCVASTFVVGAGEPPHAVKAKTTHPPSSFLIASPTFSYA